MKKTVESWRYLANKFDNEHLADEILSFSVEMKCNYSNFENFSVYPFKISFPGLVVRLENNQWFGQIKNCLSIKFICNLDVSRIAYIGVIAIINDFCALNWNMFIVAMTSHCLLFKIVFIFSH